MFPMRLGFGGTPYSGIQAWKLLRSTCPRFICRKGIRLPRADGFSRRSSSIPILLPRWRFGPLSRRKSAGELLRGAGLRRFILGRGVQRHCENDRDVTSFRGRISKIGYRDISNGRCCWCRYFGLLPRRGHRTSSSLAEFSKLTIGERRDRRWTGGGGAAKHLHGILVSFRKSIKLAG